MLICQKLHFFILTRGHFFIAFRERGRERGRESATLTRERSIHWLPPLHYWIRDCRHLDRGSNPQPRYVSPTGNQTCKLLATARFSYQHQPGLNFCVCFKEGGEILLIHGPHLCKFAYSLKFSCSPQINTCGTFMVAPRHAESSGKFESPRMAHSQPRSHKGRSALLFQLSSRKRGDFSRLLSVTVFASCCFVLISLFRTPPKHRGAVQCSWV